MTHSCSVRGFIKAQLILLLFATCVAVADIESIVFTGPVLSATGLGIAVGSFLAGRTLRLLLRTRHAHDGGGLFLDHLRDGVVAAGRAEAHCVAAGGVLRRLLPAGDSGRAGDSPESGRSPSAPVPVRHRDDALGDGRRRHTLRPRGHVESTVDSDFRLGGVFHRGREIRAALPR